MELALKGLETERERLDEEMAEIRKQLVNGAGGLRQKPAAPPQNVLGTKPKKSNLTAAGRRKLSLLMTKRWAERRKAAAKAASKN
jgi:hypothetical protein